MSKLQGKIDFTLFISVKNANPNGDPLNGNRPRTDIDGYGEISDVCIKRKIRNRMQDLGERIFVQSDERSDDGFKSLKERADGCEVLKKEIVKKKRQIGIYAQRLHVKNGQMFAVLDRYLRLKVKKLLLECGDRYPFIRQLVYRRLM